MSGNKMTDTKISEEANIDSGFNSGPLVVYPGDEDSGELIPELQKQAEEKKAPSSEVSRDKQILEMMDSGVVQDEILCDLAEDLSNVKLVDIKPETTNASSVRPQATDLPLELLFQQDDDGDTQLHIAASHGLEKPVSTLIRLCPNKELLNVCNDYGQTALHLAVLSRSAVITRMLVLAGADIGIRDRRGETPLHKATALSHVKCIQALVMPGVEHQRPLSAVLNQKNYNGQACVHVAATLGHIECLQALLIYGADVNSRENLAGWTALHIAASRGDSRLVQYLQRCSGVESRAYDYARRTPRRLARSTRAAALFVRHEDSDDSDSDDDMFDDETESLFEKFSNKNKSIVA